MRICRELSIGRKWTAKDILQIPQSILFIECCSLLYRALLIIARKVKQDDPLKAVKICTIAQKRAIDGKIYLPKYESSSPLNVIEILISRTVVQFSFQ